MNMIIGFFKKLPPSISVPVFHIFITLVMIWRFLFSSVYGMLVLVICLYMYLKTNTNIPPLTFSELLSYISGLSTEYKVAILSSSVTIAGFAVAFHTASINWRNQMQAQLKAQAAGEIESFFAMVASNITSARLYVESLVNTEEKIQKGDEDANFLVTYLQGKTEEFLAARDTLSRASVEVHRLINRNRTLLSSGLGLPENIRMAADALTKMTERMWIHLPIVNVEDPNHIQSFLRQLNVTDCHEFLKSCEVNYGKIGAISGGIHGYLSSSIWDFSFAMFYNLFKDRKNFKQAVQELYIKFNDNG